MKRALAIALLLSACAPEVGPCDDQAARRVVYDDTGSPAYEGQAIIVTSCGAGAFCHAPGIDADARRGAPAGLDYDLRVAEDDGGDSTDRLRRMQSLTYGDRHAVWAQVEAGRMPVPGPMGEEVLAAAPVYQRFDPVTETPTPMPTIDTDEGREILRNWLACRVPVVERTEPGTGDAFGAVVSRRDVVPLEPRWSDIHARLIVPRCASAACHGRVGSAGLTLTDRSAALAAMRDAPASAADECSGAGPLIAPGDANDSLFLHKLSGRDAAGDPVCGDLMPGSGSRIDPMSLESIRAWIDAGALDD